MVLPVCMSWVVWLMDLLCTSIIIWNCWQTQCDLIIYILGIGLEDILSGWCFVWLRLEGMNCLSHFKKYEWKTDKAQILSIAGLKLFLSLWLWLKLLAFFLSYYLDHIKCFICWWYLWKFLLSSKLMRFINDTKLTADHKS